MSYLLLFDHYGEGVFEMSELCGCGALVKDDICSNLLQHGYYLVGRLEAKNEEVDRLEGEITVLRERLGEKILLRARDNLVLQRDRMYPYNADELAYLYYGIEFLTDHLLGNFKHYD